MAEIRKHKHSTSAIAQAIEQAMGASVRPTTPGAGPDPARRAAPATPDLPPRGQAPGLTTSFTSAAAGGWAVVPADRLPHTPRDATRHEDEPGT